MRPNFDRPRLRAGFIEGIPRVAGEFVVILSIAHVLPMDTADTVTGIPSEAIVFAATRRAQ
jgi:hypothetical protein